IDLHRIQTDALDPAGSIELLRQQFGSVDRRCVMRCRCAGQKLNDGDLDLDGLVLRQGGSELQTRRTQGQYPSYPAHRVSHRALPSFLIVLSLDVAPLRVRRRISIQVPPKFGCRLAWNASAPSRKSSDCRKRL